MNYIIYGKKIGDRCYGAINLHEGKVGVGLVYATLIPDCGRAKMYADKLAEMVLIILTVKMDNTIVPSTKEEIEGTITALVSLLEKGTENPPGSLDFLIK